MYLVIARRRCRVMPVCKLIRSKSIPEYSSGYQTVVSEFLLPYVQISVNVWNGSQMPNWSSALSSGDSRGTVSMPDADVVFFDVRVWSLRTDLRCTFGLRQLRSFLMQCRERPRSRPKSTLQWLQ